MRSDTVLFEWPGLLAETSVCLVDGDQRSVCVLNRWKSSEVAVQPLQSVDVADTSSVFPAVAIRRCSPAEQPKEDKKWSNAAPRP